MKIDKNEIYVIIKMTERNLKGVEDDSEWDYKPTIHVLTLAESQSDEYAEHQASYYENQDYSYQVDFREICQIDGRDLSLLRDFLNMHHVKAKEVEE